MREWDGRYRDDKKGGLAWLLWQEGVVVDVVDHRGSIGLEVYRREEGNIINNRAIKAAQSKT